MTTSREGFTSVWIEADKVTSLTNGLHPSSKIAAIAVQNSLSNTQNKLELDKQRVQIAVASNILPSNTLSQTIVRPKVSMVDSIEHFSATVLPAKMSPMILPKTMEPSSPMIVGISPSQLAGTPQQYNVASPQWSSSDSFGAGRKRCLDLDDSPESIERKKRGKRLPSSAKTASDKGGKGLRHFSMKVCEKVQQKGTTSYNEVADELVQEFSDPIKHISPADQQYDQKNIRRRVYDALNVLMAMNIISKEKKEIKWIGLPTNSQQECQQLEVEKTEKLERIKQKTAQLQELILQQIAFKNLVQRNRKIEEEKGAPRPNTTIHLPFIIVNTNKKTVIDCSISNDKFEYLFNFDNRFEIHDDIEVLKRMGMAFGLEKNKCSESDAKIAKTMVPKALAPYVTDLATNGPAGYGSTGITPATPTKQGCPNSPSSFNTPIKSSPLASPLSTPKTAEQPVPLPLPTTLTTTAATTAITNGIQSTTTEGTTTPSLSSGPSSPPFSGDTSSDSSRDGFINGADETTN